MKHIFITAAVIVITLLTIFVPVYAQDASTSPTITGANRPGQIRKELRDEEKGEIQTQRKTVLDNFKNTINTIKNQFARIIGAQVTGKSSSTLTISKDGKTYTVNISSTSSLRRRFWGNATIDEISVGDAVNVWGKFTDTTMTAIDGRLIRDLSIMKRFGVFFGTVTAINGNTITLQSVNRGVQIVTVSSTTKFTNRKEATIALTDIAVNHKIRVKGMWDKASNTITEVSIIKDFTLPPVTTPTGTTTK